MASASAADGALLDTRSLQKDGTGCHCTWPAAEELTDFLLRDSWSPPDRVIEIGSGTGLPGLLIAKRWPSTQVTLTDYHPFVLSALRESVARNGLRSNTRVRALDWDAGERLARWPLVIGADLAVTSRGASSVARLVRRLLLGEGRRQREADGAGVSGGVFLYAHTERRAIYRHPADGSLVRETTDTALEALICALGTSGGDPRVLFECREVPRAEPDAERGAGEQPAEDPVRLFAFAATQTG